MLHTDHLPARRAYVSPIERLRRRHRSVVVRVYDWGHAADSFEVSMPETLRAEMQFIHSHMPRGSRVELSGVEEESLPLGLARSRREVQLGNLNSALDFLAA